MMTQKTPDLSYLKLFVDMDGTLAEWKSASAYEDLFEEGYFRNLQPHANVVEAIRRLSARGVPVYVLSAYLSDSQYALSEKNAWLDEHAPFIDGEHRLFCANGAKAELVHKTFGLFDRFCVLLDDYSDNLHSWSAHGGTGIKLLNGVNGTKGTWKSCPDNLAVDRFVSPEELEANILQALPSPDSMQYSELCDIFCAYEREHPDAKPLTGYVLITADSFTKPYSEESRTYSFSSRNKAFMPGMCGYSIYADSLDGTDIGVRLEAYIAAERGGQNGWKIEKCWIGKD